MPAKSVACLGIGLAALGILAGGGLPVCAKAPLPTVLLFPASSGDVPAMADLRTRLRLDSVFQVLTYDPDSASIKRVAAETSHPEWLVAPGLTDDARLALARALGVVFYIVVSPGRAADETHLELVETAPPALTFDWNGVNRQYGARALESQAQAAISQQASAAASASAQPLIISAEVAPPPAPLVVAPAPSSPKSEPLPEASPSLTQTLPVVTPPVVPLPPVTVSAPEIKPLPVPEIAPAPPSTLVAAAAPVSPPVPIVVVPHPVITIPVISTPVVSAPLTPTPVIVITPPAPPIQSSAPAPAAADPVRQMAMLPPRALLPEPAAPTPPSPVYKPQAKPEDLAAVMPLMTKGDASLEGGDVVGAISLFRQAVNGAPLSVVPRLRLAQAYQKGGLTDKALDEAKRALEIAPDNLPVQQFLTDLDQQNGTSDGSIARYQALLDRSPDDAGAHSGLAEALWNSGDLAGAEAEYKTAKKLAPPNDHSADAHLAQLYASQARYDDCLTALSEAGKNGYALAIRIVRSRADTLSSTTEAARDSFAAGKSTREQFYKGAQNVSVQAQALADFVAKVTPPADYKLSHLHRILSTNLLAQEAATLVAFIETGNAAQGESVSKLDKAAQTEMLTAQATEEKLGLWEKK